MPFGLVFGALFLVAWAGWAATGFPLRGALGLVAAGIAIALACGLALRQPWARWAEAAFVLFVSAAGAILSTWRGGAMDLVMLVGGLLTLAFLLVPATGDPRRGVAAETRPWRRTGRVVGWLTLAATGLLIASGVAAIRHLPVGKPAASVQDSGGARNDGGTQDSGSAGGSGRARAVPAAARVEWLDYGSGVSRAKATGKPMFIDFFASWCGPCKMMERETFRDAEVRRRLSEIVAVKVDSEETEARPGPSGADVADRFGVSGYPTLVVLDAEGREVSRLTGFVPPDDFTTWLARSIEKAEGPRKRPRALSTPTPTPG